MGSPCVFCDIVRGETAAHTVLEGDDVVAFLDRRPLFHGHTLVVPRAHHETLADLPTDAVGSLFAAVQRLTIAVRDATGSDGALVAQNNVVSQSVPHLHVHVIPRRFKDGLKGFFWPRHPYASDEDAVAVADRIRERLSA